MGESIKVFAPATVANVSSAFDVLGFAINGPGDEIVLTKNSTNRLFVKEIRGDGGMLSKEPDSNTATVSIQSFLSKIGSNQGFDLVLTKKMPLGSGLGSSSASAVAGVFAANELMGCPIKRKDLLPFAMEGERIACGIPHADNVGPSLLGGFVLISSYQPLLVRNIRFPPDLIAVVVHPHFEIRTKDSRSVLPNTLQLTEATSQWGRIAGLIAGLGQADFELISMGLIDKIIEPSRSALIPGFSLVKEAAIANGALGCSISGSGPSVFALATTQVDVNRIARAMQDSFAKAGLESDSFISNINETGVCIVD
jgi:homoserine kinase